MFRIFVNQLTIKYEEQNRDQEKKKPTDQKHEQDRDQQHEQKIALTQEQIILNNYLLLY